MIRVNIKYISRSKETPFATPILILIENTFTMLKYSLLSRGYHVYKDVWVPIIGDDSLTCEREEHNENDQTAVAIIWVDLVSKKIVRHVPLNWSKVASKFPQITNHHIRAEVTGKNRDVDVESIVVLSQDSKYL